MRFINIFLASSIVELDYERQAIGNFVRALNDIYSPKGIYFKLHMCEDMSEALTLGRKQDEYNEIARSCDYFFMLLHRKAGRFTIEEFDQALASFKRNKEEGNVLAPMIVAFVKPVAGDESEEVQRFLDRYCGELQQYPSIFDGVDTVKLKMLLHLERNERLPLEVSMRNSELFIGDTAFDCVHLDRVPMYSNSDSINRYTKMLRMTESELEKLRGEGEENSDAYRLKEQMLADMKDNLCQFESKLLDTAKTVASCMFSGMGLTDRARKAAECLDDGRVDDALKVLDNEARRRELNSSTARYKHHIQCAAEESAKMYRLVHEAIIKISALKMDKNTTENAQEILSIYEEIKEPITLCDFDRAPLISYAVMLREQNQYDKALAEAEELYEYYTACGDESTSLAKVCDILARIYYARRDESFTRAEQFYLKAIEIHEKTENRAELSFVLTNLGYFYKSLCRYPEAKAAFSRACDIRRKLSEEDSVYRAKYAWSLTGLADVLSTVGDTDEAIAAYVESLEIRREIAKSSFNDRRYVARTAANLARTYIQAGDASAARELAREAARINRDLMVLNPNVHSGLAAQSCVILAAAEIKLGRLESAEDHLGEAEEMLESSKDSYTKERIADMWLVKGVLADARGEDSAECYRKALELRRERAVNGAVAIFADVALDCLSLGRALVRVGRSGEAMPYLEEAAGIWSKHLELNPRVFGKMLAICKEDIKRTNECTAG